MLHKPQLKINLKSILTLILKYDFLHGARKIRREYQVRRRNTEERLPQVFFTPSD